MFVATSEFCALALNDKQSNRLMEQITKLFQMSLLPRKMFIHTMHQLVWYIHLRSKWNARSS